ncbi:hypothetical protein HELRODRAFT_71763 [Helobdella robusta]|uniref:carbonic anhydrase n=1 Tax=Helobdella robusta TaxID=6412 RepID=T1G0R2_HELRO|nr:hypothetical protein HELRODRAFT_71763 [Helobdella robusta]ESO11606.1 hypothetical protein HELRODRAFT_71763 [Helobdella robusta]
MQTCIQTHIQTKGPSHWYEQSPNCNGSRQSPIEITTSTLNTSLTPFVFNKYDVIPSKIVVTNNGHTVTVSLPNDVLTIRDGGLDSQYTFAQFHFHWGSNDSYGSEHLDHNKAYSAELHFVHWNSGKYSSVAESYNYADGLAVLGVLIDVHDPRINQDLDILTESFHSIEYLNNWTSVAPFKLINLFPPERDYYRYYGSLTTPGCNEIVVWTLFKNPIYLSSVQVFIF